MDQGLLLEPARTWVTYPRSSDQMHMPASAERRLTFHPGLIGLSCCFGNLFHAAIDA